MPLEVLLWCTHAWQSWFFLFVLNFNKWSSIRTKVSLFPSGKRHNLAGNFTAVPGSVSYDPLQWKIPYLSQNPSAILWLPNSTFGWKNNLDYVGLTNQPTNLKNSFHSIFPHWQRAISVELVRRSITVRIMNKWNNLNLKKKKTVASQLCRCCKVV